VPKVLVAILIRDGGIEAACQLVTLGIVHATGKGKGTKGDLDTFGGEYRPNQLGCQPLR